MIKYVAKALSWDWQRRNWDNNIYPIRLEHARVKVLSPPFMAYSHGHPLTSWCFPMLRSSSHGPSKLLSLRQQQSCYLYHRFSIQSELGVNRLLSLAAWSNLLSPCSCIFLYQLNLIIVSWLSALLYFSETKGTRRTLSLPAEQRARALSCPALDLTGEAGMSQRTLENQNSVPASLA